MRSHSLALVGLLALALAVPALADSGATTLAAGEESSVATMTLRAGDSVSYQWSTGLSVEFAIERGGTEVFNTTGPVVSGSYTAPSDGTYVFSFRNHGAYLTIVSWNLQKHAASVFDGPNALLIGGAATAGIVVAIAGVALWMRKRGRAPASPPPPPPS